MKFSKISATLLIFQLLIVTSIAAKYLYQRRTCPRAWVRVAAYDPERVMSGRYLSLNLLVDGCGTVEKRIKTDDDVERVVVVQLVAKHGRLYAIPAEDKDLRNAPTWVATGGDTSCEALRVQQPTDFYIAEHAKDPSRLEPGQELWVEVTVPPKGPPRPIQLAIEDHGVWRPLAFQ